MPNQKKDVTFLKKKIYKYLFSFVGADSMIDYEFEEQELHNKDVFEQVHRVLERYRANTPEYVNTAKRRRITSSGTNNVQKQLTSLVTVLYPFSVDHAPTEETFKKVKRWFCTPNHFIRSFQARRHFVRRTARATNMHASLSEYILHPTLSHEEELLWTQVKHKSKSRPKFIGDLYRLYSLNGSVLQTCGDLSVRDAALFCSENNGRRCETFADLIVLLLHTGFRHTEQELEAAIEEELVHHDVFKELLDNFPPLRSRRHWSFASFRACVQLIGTPAEAVTNYTPSQISDVILSLGQEKHNVYRMYHMAFCRMGRADVLASLEDCSVSSVTRVQRLSAWHKGIYQEMLLHEREESKHRTSFPENHLKSTASFFCRFVLFLETHTGGLEAFLRSATIDQVTEAIRAQILSMKVCNERVKADDKKHQGKTYVSRDLHFLKGTLRKHLLQCKDKIDDLTCAKVLRTVPNKREPSEKRRNYTEDEMDRMAACVSDPADAVIMILLRQVALRTSAIGNTRYEMLLDGQHCPRTNCKIPEKGGKLREFIPSTQLKSKIKALSDFLREHFQDDLATCYLFNLSDIRAPRSHTSLNYMIKTIAAKALVQRTGITPHIHMFRHTLVSNLIEAGNSMELSAKYMGHASAATTSNKYYKPNIRQVQALMNVPWDPQASPPESQVSMLTEQLVASNRIIQTMAEVIGGLSPAPFAQVQQELHARLPNLKQILQDISPDN
jgi:integrase